MSIIAEGFEWQADALAEIAEHDAEVALNSFEDDDYVDPDRITEAYASGVADVLRLLLGGEPAERLRPIYDEYLRQIDPA